MSASLVFLILALPVCALGMLRYRSDYRRLGRTSGFGVVLLLLAWIMPHFVLGFAIPLFPAPSSAMQWIGYWLMALAVALLVLPMRGFTPGMVVGHDAGRLVTGGVYRWTRNPQYVFYAPFPLGYALTGSSVLAYVGVALVYLVMHLTALVEEEHLERVFGDAYRRYRESTPRYLGRPR